MADEHASRQATSIERLVELLSQLPEVPKLADLNRAGLILALRRCAENRTLAARELGISVRTLQRSLRRWAESDGA